MTHSDLLPGQDVHAHWATRLDLGAAEPLSRDRAGARLACSRGAVAGRIRR